MKRKLIEEYNWGVYIWKTPEGKVVKNSDGDLLLINSIKNDQIQMEKLKKAAESCGIEGGQPIFLSGHRPVTEEQYEHQKARLAAGLVPDELDYFAAKEELEARKKNGRF